MNIAKTSFWITLLLVVGYFFAFIKESFIANYFGVSADVDAYNIAIQVPVIIFSFVAVAIKSVVIPVFSDIYYNKGEKQANHFANSFLTLNVFIALFILVVVELLGGVVIKIFAPGFSQETHDVAVNLLRVTMPTIVFTVFTDIITGILNVRKKLVLPCLAVYFLQITIIISLVVLHGKFGIKAACYGQVLGSALQMIYLCIIARKVYHFKPSINFKSPEVIKALKMSGPVIWGISIAEVNAMVNRIVGSLLIVGSISALSYANKINSVFMTFCIHAISIIVYPLYSESSAKNDIAQLNHRVNTTLSVYTAMLLPIMLGLFALRKEVIIVAFARGAFDQDAVMVTKSVLGFYTIGMLFSAFRETLTKVFYSMKDTATVAKNATLGVIINIVLNVTLPWILGVQGIALSASLSAMFISIRLLWLLTKKNEEIMLKEFYKNLKGIGISAIIMFVLVMLFEWFFSDINSIYMLIICGFGGAIIYFALLLVTQTPIIKEVKKYVK